MLDRIWLPLSYYLLLMAGLGACLYLFLSFKREVRRLEGHWKRRNQELEETVQAMQTHLDELRERLCEAEERTGVLVPPPPTTSGLNLSKRTQALRMFARGETPEHIAAALSLPESEVQLLLKVQKMVAEQAHGASALRLP
jgi:DNA-binding NarL/FixJ family response regulator